jgi:hypothetical protein
MVCVAVIMFSFNIPNNVLSEYNPSSSMLQPKMLLFFEQF